MHIDFSAHVTSRFGVTSTRYRIIYSAVPKGQGSSLINTVDAEAIPNAVNAVLPSL